MALTHRFLGLIVVAASVLLNACTTTELVFHTAKKIGGIAEEEPTGREDAVYKVGKPYEISGVWYYPAVDFDYSETGIASWYGADFHGRPTANGEIYDMNRVTAAHRTLPMPSMLQVTNLENGRSISVRVNDRGPFKRGRIVDLSRRGAQLLGFERNGTAKVRVEILQAESRRLAAEMTAGNGTKVAEKNGVKAASRAKISTEPLPPPPGMKAAKPAVTENGLRLAAKPAPARRPTAKSNGTLAAKDAKVTIVPIEPTKIYVQAGAFSQFHNANRLKVILSRFGPAKVTAVAVGEYYLFRVRLGPMNSLPDADGMLAKIIGAGYPEARLIVD
jgi:rare lipoprotein A